MSDIVAEQIRQLRKARGWDTAALAARCAGDEITDNVIENIESGRRANGRRRRDVTVDEIFTLAEALGVSPADLLPPGTPAAGSLGFSPELIDQLTEQLAVLRQFMAGRAENEGGA